MRIATWNLESVRALTPNREVAFRQAMSGIRADVWVLTETWADWPPVEGYTPVAASCEADDLRAWHNRRWAAVWVRPELRAIPLPVRNQPDRMVSVRIGPPGGEGFVVVGTVLPWMSDPLWPGARGYCDALAQQAAEWDELCGAPRTDTLAIAGDFNQSLPHRQYYGCRQNEAALYDALNAHDLVCLTLGNDPSSDTPRIDHIFVSRNGVNVHCLPEPGTWASRGGMGEPVTDHAGVFVDL